MMTTLFNGPVARKNERIQSTVTSYPDCPSAEAFVLCMYGAAWGVL